GILPDPRAARPEEEALDLRAARLAEAAGGRGHPARGVALAGQQERDPAAARRAAEERAGRAPVRAPDLHGAPQSLTGASRDGLARARHAGRRARVARAAVARARGRARDGLRRRKTLGALVHDGARPRGDASRDRAPARTAARRRDAALLGQAA